MNSNIIKLLNTPPSAAKLWQEDYKIPWNDPDFSRRMLAEHLTQDHDLASRRAETIEAQVRWLCENILRGSPASILDLGCGPGLYAPHFVKLGHSYLGVDFGPASIEYARKHAIEGCRFRLGNVLDAELEGPHDLVAMLYGEINVFPPDSTRQLIARAHEALGPEGRVVFEVHTPETVRALGQGRSWQAAHSGLFSDSPHVTLTEGFF